jgi:acetolactate synthase-1/2/3 large subunit
VDLSAPTPPAPAKSTVAARTGGTALVECLAAHQIPLWTCVPGESFLAVLDALWHAQRSAAAGVPGPRVITTRHEAAAANMAEAAGKLTGRAAVCLVTRGPGASHASIALHTAYQDGTPLILVVGQVSRSLLGRDAFQEMDYEHVFGSSAKSVVTISDADRIPELVAQAVHVAHSGRPGPVVLVVPEDVQYDLTSAPVRLASPAAAPPLTPADRDALLGKLGAARRPVLIVGGPGWTQSVGDDVTAFAERHAIPMAAAFRWQDAVDNASPGYAGYLGLGGSPELRQHVLGADLIVALGPRLDDPTSNGYRLDAAAGRTVLVSQAPGDLGGPPAPAPALAIHASLESAARALRAAELPAAAGRPEWRAKLRAGQERFREPNGEGLKLDTAVVVAHLREVLPADAIVTNGAGNYAIWLQRFFEFRQFGTQLAPRNGAMGYGVPAGLAAAALHPDRPVVTMAGDGCFLMSGNELATAVQFGLNVTVIVVNNGMLGTIRMHQERTFPGHAIATELRNPDFTAYAESFGALGLLVERTEEFPAALARALAHPGPALIELRTDPEQLTPDARLGLPGGGNRHAQHCATRPMKHNPDKCLSISCPAPSASPSDRQPSSRRRELRMMASATGPTVSARSCVHPTATPATRASTGSPVASPSRLKISACAAALRSHASRLGRQAACWTLADSALRCADSMRWQAARTIVPCIKIRTSSFMRPSAAASGLLARCEYSDCQIRYGHSASGK